MDKKMIKAIIWDMDGVIIDSETHYQKLEKEFLGRLGIFPNEAVLANFMGTPFTEYFPVLAKEYGSTKTLEEAKVEYHKFIQELYRDHVGLMPGIGEVFRALSPAYQYALATSTTKKLAEGVLEKFNLLKYFSVRVHGDDVNNGKPDPEIFLKALNKLGFEKDQAVIIEDSMNGMKAGKAAGIRVIAYKGIHNKDLDFSSADYVVGDLREIPGVIREVLNG